MFVIFFQKEKKILETKRLDLDAAKTKNRRAKSQNTQVSLNINWRECHLVLNARLHDQNFPSKTWSKFSLTKFCDHVNLHKKWCHRTLMNFDILETHSIFLKTLSLVWDLTNQSIFRIKIYVNKSTRVWKKFSFEQNFRQKLLIKLLTETLIV